MSEKENYKEEETQFGVKTTHPAYGTIMFNRAYGSRNTLFGSSIEHDNVITMELHHASMTRFLHSDDVCREGLIAKVEMSYSQFAEAITSFGCGSGIPCTIRYTEKDGRIPECDFVSKRKQFTDEFKNKMEKAMEKSRELLSEVSEIFSSKKTLTKADKTEILSKLTMLSYDIGSNIDFIADQFNRQMDKTVMEAKGEIEAFCQNKINSIAQTALTEHKNEFVEIENPVDLEV